MAAAVATANSKKAVRTSCTVYENPLAISTNEDPKKTSMFTTYEIKWETFGRGRRTFLGQKRDFPLMQEMSNWLHDLTPFNSDDPSLVEKDWDLIHVSPGHLFIFLIYALRICRNGFTILSRPLKVGGAVALYHRQHGLNTATSITGISWQSDSKCEIKQFFPRPI